MLLHDGVLKDFLIIVTINFVILLSLRPRVEIQLLAAHQLLCALLHPFARASLRGPTAVGIRGLLVKKWVLVNRKVGHLFFDPLRENFSWNLAI